MNEGREVCGRETREHADKVDGGPGEAGCTQFTVQSLNRPKLSPRNNFNFEFLQLLGINQLDRTLLLAGEEIGNFDLKLFNVV